MSIWLTDPKDGQRSVSLTLMVISFIGVVVAGSLQLAKITESASVFLELFGTTAALYFGRRFSINGKQYATDSNETKEST